ncbi:MAG: amidohydrolase family protein [Pseudomonadales bacterium]|jgi:Tol biopolymer transport system component/imidazolonepropionase-like amidohydrolase
MNKFSYAFIAILVALTSYSFAEESADETWDIEGDNGGELSRIQFSTDEGTWMNVDVSPKGDLVVFDLLGDIYVMPISGGKATPLTQGRALDIQPRFSPDGEWVSFTSDRNGADNIWVMRTDGSDARAISNEDFRLLNNAWWHPNGEYLVARKHFTGTRSLGAGEMWLYHVNGGDGIQLTERRNEQQDSGEPAFSPDGRYVYFSEDTTRGPFFQYNKDANGEIYQIQQLDMETGELDTLISGYGGSARPSPSPDGKYIAFVRRHRGDTQLWLYERESGRQFEVYGNLEHDQQEAWAIFGVYPNISWTPDAESLLFWAEGKIKRLEVASGDVVEVPFSVDVDMPVVSAVEHQFAIPEGQFDAQMIRDVTTSPDGSKVVFHAAGFLWISDTDSGEAKRLTRSSDFEYQPSFSPDGRRVIYVAWSDENLGQVRSVNLRGRSMKTLTQRPGYYANPTYSLDGDFIAYERTSGNDLLGYVYGVDTGIFVAEDDGDEARKVSVHGRRPQFDAGGNGVYFLDGYGLEKQFMWVGLQGGDERNIFDLKYVNDIKLSPARDFVAFTELFTAYVAPLPSIGKAIELSRNTTAIPVDKVAENSGSSLHWSRSGEQLHWMTGNSYHSASLSALLDDADAEPSQLTLSATMGVAAPTEQYALVGARVITGRQGEVLEEATVLIDGNKIAGVVAEADIPADYQRIDVTGKTIIPGLVDAHAHAEHFYGGVSPQSNWAYLANLAYGVTTIQDPSASTEFVFGQAEMVRSGAMLGPRVYSTGSILYGADGDFKAEINSLDDARTHLARLKAVGATSVKSYNQPRRDQRQQVNQAARELGLLVVMEGGSTFYHNLSMILDGATGIEHNIPVAPLYRDMEMLWQNTNVGYTPTLVVSYGGMSGEYYWYQHDDVFDAEPLRQFVPNDWLDARSLRRQKTPEFDYYHIEVSEAVNRVKSMGVSVQVGGHGQMQGLAMHWEMWNLGLGGMTPLDIIHSATLSGAEYLGLDAHLGSIEAGKLADLVILEDNPLEDIRHSDSMSMVVINGELRQVNDLANLLQDGEGAPTVWHRRDGAVASPTNARAHSH